MKRKTIQNINTFLAIIAATAMLDVSKVEADNIIGPDNVSDSQVINTLPESTSVTPTAKRVRYASVDNIPAKPRGSNYVGTRVGMPAASRAKSCLSVFSSNVWCGK